MGPRTISCRSWLPLCWAIAALLAASFEALGLQPKGLPPARLRLSVERSTLRPGDRTRITVRLLDRYYKPTANDVARRIAFATKTVDRQRGGQGGATPAQITVAAGAWSSQDAVFEASRPGRVLLMATSAGLEGSDTLIIIVPRRASFLDRLLFPTAYAQSPVAVEIFPDQFAEPLPANNYTPAELYVTLDRELSKGERLLIRVKTFPGVRVQYHDQQWTGSVDLTIEEGNARSDKLYLYSAEPGTVRVTAQVLPGGPQTQLSVPFELPRPQYLIFDRARDTIASRQSEIPLLVRLADQKNVPVGKLDREYRVHLSCLNEPAISRFEPAELSFSAAHPTRQSMLRLSRVPRRGELKLYARDSESTLVPAEMLLIFNVATPVSLVLLLAGFGGVLGALARQCYKEGVRSIWPRWTRGVLNLGMLGNSLFGIFFGIFVFLAVQLGLLQPLQLPDKLEGALGGMLAVAFLFGGIGGFSGILALEKLSDRYFPGSGTTAARSAGDA